MVPLVAGLAAGTFREASGPRWLAPTYDVEYPYLLTALRITEGLAIEHYHHPALPPVHVYAAVLSTLSFGEDRASFLRDVLARPEDFLQVLFLTSVVAGAACLLAAGVLVLRWTQSLGMALLAQVGPLLFVPSLEVFAGVSPDAWLIGLSALFVSLTFFSPTQGRAWSIVTGVIGATGLATKLTFAPLALAPWLVARQLRARLFYGAAFVLSFLVWLLPLRGHLTDIAVFGRAILTRSGDYGGGGPATLGGSLIGAASGLRLLVIQNKVPVFLLGVALVSRLAWRGRRREEHPEAPEGDGSATRRLVVLLGVACLYYLLVARQAYPRYLIPAMACIGPALAFAFLPWIRHPGPSRRRAWIPAALVLLGVAVTARNFASLRGRAIRDRDERLRMTEIASKLRAGGETVVTGSWASSPAKALATGMMWAGDDWTALARGLHPGELFLSPSGEVRTWEEGLEGRVGCRADQPLGPEASLRWSRLMGSGKGVVVQADRGLTLENLLCHWPSHVQEIYPSRLEPILRLR